MPLLVIASIVLQFACLVHMVRSGRPYWWLWVILAGSFIGCAVYIVTQVIPDLRHDPRARRAARGVTRALDPERERRRISAQLEVADTVAKRLELAHECLALGDHVQAEGLYASCLKGPHANDPDILLGLAHAQFARGDAAASRATLDRLITANPGFESSDGHLLYARSLEALGDAAGALHEYEVLARSYPGEEARARYALLLAREGRVEPARAVLKEMQARLKIAPAYYRKQQRPWIDEVQRSLGA